MPETRLGYVDTRVGQLHFVRSGEGLPIVLLPGAGQSHNVMRRLMAELSSNFEVFAINPPGSGYSAPLPDGADFPFWADAITDAISELSISKPSFYGIYTGNKIAASVAGRYPEIVSSLILCGQSHSLIPGMAKRNDLMRKVAGRRALSNHGDAVAQLRGRLALWRELETIWWSGDLAVTQLSEDELQLRRLAVGDLLLADNSMRQLYQANFAYDLEADLRRVTCPTLIVEIATPREDQQIGRQGELLQQIIPGARITTFEEADGLGLTLEDRAGELAAVITDFLRTKPAVVHPE